MVVYTDAKRKVTNTEAPLRSSRWTAWSAGLAKRTPSSLPVLPKATAAAARNGADHKSTAKLTSELSCTNTNSKAVVIIRAPKSAPVTTGSRS